MNDGEGVGEVLLGVLDGDLVDADTVVHGHGEVGDEGKGGDEGRQDMEQAFLLGMASAIESVSGSGPHLGSRVARRHVRGGKDVRRGHERPLRRRQ